MPVTKKSYLCPGIESERLDLPQAWGCDIHLNGTSRWYYGDAYQYQTPTWDC